MLRERAVITLLTDFGLEDSFVAQMKGVILTINPLAEIVDISHSIESFNVRNAAVTLGMCYSYFPPYTIHLAVVDPGVGSTRRPLLVVTDRYFFVGPDNGIFSFIYHDNPNTCRMFHITQSKYFLNARGATFHGRDVFAPIAAYISRGVPIEDMGSLVQDAIRFKIPQPVSSKNAIEGEVFSIDRFGNCITNINMGKLKGMYDEDALFLKIKKMKVQVKRFYSEVFDKGLYALINSSGYLELFVFQDSAEQRFDIVIGDKVELCFRSF